jgi:hypothetical protein
MPTDPYAEPKDPLLPVPPSRHPFQVWLVTACLLSGTFTLAGVTSGSDFEEALPQWTTSSWGLLLVVAGALILAGAWWRDHLTGLIMERIGLRVLGWGCLIYAFVIIQQAWPASARGGVIIASAGVASLWRRRHCIREIETLRRWIRVNLT